MLDVVTVGDKSAKGNKFFVRSPPLHEINMGGYPVQVVNRISSSPLKGDFVI